MANRTPNVRTLLKIFYALPILFVLGLCGFLAWKRAIHQPPPPHKLSGAPFATTPIGGLTAKFFTASDQMHAAGNDVFIEFYDAHTNLVDVGEVTIELGLSMPNMVMHSIGKVLRTSTPGQYRTTLEPQIAGDWKATLGFNGSHGVVETNFVMPVH